MRREKADGTRADAARRRRGGSAANPCAVPTGLILSLGVLVGVVAAPTASRAQDATGGVLAECAALSPRLDDLHGCLDDYLDAMDERLADLAAVVERSLDDKARTAFTISQKSFALFRRDNCLWYLAFSTPRNEAELIAKDCLATISLQRLSELQRLTTADGGEDAVQSGYYVYGANRNTFRPCGAERRYWVEGEAAVVGELQQAYLDAATEPLQVLFASLRGTLDGDAQTTSGHDGVLRADALVELRVPREADCRLPATEPPRGVGVAANPALEPSVALAPEEAPPAAEQGEPEQQLTAYFGAWLADCTERAASRACRLSVSFEEDTGGVDDGSPQLSLTRRDAEFTAVELEFPSREIDSPAKIRWSIDGQVIGDIVGSTIRVDERSARQLVEAPRYVQDELLPLMIDGGQLEIDLLESVDDERGERFRATLVGLTRALGFADDFIRDGSGL